MHHADWSVEPILEWLMGEGRRLRCPGELTEQLGQQLLASGCSVARIRLSLRTLHPLVSGSSFTWWRDQNLVDEYRPPHSIQQSDDYLGSPVEYVQNTGRPIRYRLDSVEKTKQGHSLLRDLYDDGIRDYVAYPMYQVHSDSYTVFILATDNDAGFSEQALAQLEKLSRYLAPVMEVLSLDSSAKALLNTYLGPRSGQRVLDGQVQRGDGEVIESALWYSDLRNFTAISEQLPPPQLLKLLNCYFEKIKAAVSEHGGEIMRFIGDAMLIIFPADESRTPQQACWDALAAAKMAQRLVREANEELGSEGMPEIRYGLGLDLGRVIYGNVGAIDRLDFTVMGNAVNRAARLQELTKTNGFPLITSEAFAAQFAERDSCRFESCGRIELKGIAEPVKAFGMNY
ncbi:adenylate/guanylate cyclase domain-containing protein [Motiliproteus sp.]|uniref:adenylate/guanylate cyclase domain-containing protein n=1 Tax=Motiliproteus sp. TaxID=1898955 RepID=UPI003BA9635C